MITKSLGSKLMRGFGSELFFRITLVWFGLQALWIALSGLYPMAYDEAFHFNLTQLYADKLHPFWNAVPEGSSTYGAIARDPSYMYHYLMSFPLRFVEAFIGSLTGQVIFMRLCSVVFFVCGLYLFRKVLRRAAVSNALSNVLIAMVAATPLVPLLAAQVNYDNLIFLLLPASILYFQKIIAALRNQTVDTKSVLQWLALCMLAALVKYAFLPLALFMACSILVSYIRHIHASPKRRIRLIIQSFRSVSPRARMALVGICIVLFGLIFERYGLNIVKYHTPTPECDQVLSVDACLNFSPWRRNYYTRQSKLAGKLVPRDTRFIPFAVKTWASNTTFQLFYTLDGARANYVVGDAYPIPRKASVFIIIGGISLYLVQYVYLRKRFTMGILAGIALFYCVILLLQNYADFINLGYPFGIQGRYLIPVLPILYAALGIAWSSAFRKLPFVRPWIALVALVVIVTQGGGAGTYILRSNSDWYWPNRYVIRANDAARKVLKPWAQEHRWFY